MRIEGSNRRLSLHWTSLAEGNANFSIVIVFRYADDLMVGFEHREEAERLQGINQHASAPSKYASRRRVGVYAMNPETRPLFPRCTADGKRFPMTTNSEASEGESAPVTVVLNWAAGLKKQARRHSERPTYNSPPGHFLVKLRRSRWQVSARRKLHRAVDAQVATANSIPWSSTAKFSRNGVLVAPLRVSYALLGKRSL